jgi:hypothetical protein
MGRAPATASDLEVVKRAFLVFEEAPYSWYEPKPFWYLYFSGVVKLVTGMFSEEYVTIWKGEYTQE